MLVALGAPALEQACDYLNICALGLPMIFGYNALSSPAGCWKFQNAHAHRNSRHPIERRWTCCFVGPLQMGDKRCRGRHRNCADAFLLLALLYMLRHRELFELRPCFFKIRPALTASIFKLGIPSALQNTIGSISWLVVTLPDQLLWGGCLRGQRRGHQNQGFLPAVHRRHGQQRRQHDRPNPGCQKFDRAKQVMDETMKITLLISAGMIAIVELFTPQLVAVFSPQTPKLRKPPF